MDGNGFFPGGIWILFVVIFAVLAIIGWRANKKRQERLRAFAAQRGWVYTANVPTLVNRWQSPPFRQGSSRRASEVLTGTFHGEQISSFTYTYTTGSGKNRTTHHYHVVSLHLPTALPGLQLTPEGAGTAIAKFFGGQDIEFESAAFNDAWRVRASSARFAYDFIHPRMMERLLQGDAVGRSITVEGEDIYLWANGRQQLAYIDAYLNLLYGIVDRVPRHLWLNVGHDPLAE
ncbi:hypothetical protein EXU48_02230 [Occultella glacieicola]|uniref:DUF3137 domain-containing protein n=1 Tax=Occultella glacieicola TaxID=2518684 RepID=A0ABY2EAQ5_9MICO|nr:hypothetical protein [Occultella glacieicola]TDE99025.1 hypothetical protein EXU48_02230 [Occultella glacieicola]